MKKCTKCKRKKRFDLFYKNNKAPDGHAPRCKKCELAWRKSRCNTSEGAAARILDNMKSRSIKKGFKPPEFTKEDIINIIENEKCTVSNRSFDIKYESKYHANPFNASPDRLSNDKGYTKDNVRWVCFWINNCRGDYDIDFFKKLIRGVRWK